jgi:hypothetical protein
MTDRSMVITAEVKEAWRRLIGEPMTPDSMRAHWGKAVTFDELRRARDAVLAEKAQIQ